jgi:predicted DNA-binding transcriptional regulator
MPNYTIKKERKTEDEIILCVEELIEKYRKLIQESNAEIKRRFNVFTINAQVKRMMFLNFNLDATLTIEDGKIAIAYNTNIPVEYVEQVKKEIYEMLEESPVHPAGIK